MSFHWLEDWKTPGVCLVARSIVHNRGWVGTLANRLMTASGIWAYVHENEALLVDAPFAWQDSQPILTRIDDFLRRHDLRLKFITASHLHLDHSAGLSCLLEHFPEAPFVYPETWPGCWRCWSKDRIKYGIQPAMSQQWGREPCQTYRQWWTSHLGGEPVYFLEAPYHSLTDQLIGFRGFTVLPDWHLPSHLDEPLQLVDAPRRAIEDTLLRLQMFERQTGHSIQTSCAVHGDEPLRTDFQERVRIASRKFLKSAPAQPV
ncbi:MAG: MBL fold metallo-hydrolase [Planctomycetaceae bacterium]|nr:MBL fold metallo-hydrolase [Planctomycetaceae bacterium]